jgi:protein-ribulosamine 3-kinase
MLPYTLHKAVEQLLSSGLKQTVTILRACSIGGGCINHAHRIETTNGNYFLKWNNADAYPGMFEAEAKGLTLLHSANALYIPETIATREVKNLSFILLELINCGRRTKNFWADFGEKLAQLHNNTSQAFGLDHDNYIGSLPQSNKRYKKWNDFFIYERLEKQIELARNSDAIDNLTIEQFNNFFNRIDELIPEEQPALLHGDLWNGNYMVASDGTACLIDPAVYYGHREMDLAMTKLFGGFDPKFYESYHSAFSLQPGFENRVNIHNLYALMVHVNLFGGGYLQQVKSILSKF